MLAPPPCSECGSDSVYHPVERWLVAFDRAFTILLRPLNPILRLTYRLASPGNDFLASKTLDTLGLLGLGKWQYDYDERDALRTRALFETAPGRGIELREFRLLEQPHMSFLVAERGGRVRVFDGLPRPNFLVSKNLIWMDDKGVLKKKFLKQGFPVAKGGAVWSKRKALRIFRELEKPVIVKPSTGSGSRHTTIHLENEESFLEAFRSAKRLSPWVIVEEELLGPVFRATVIGGKLIGVVRRDPPQVLGDGKASVRQLVAAANRDPRRQGPIFSEIATGPEADLELARQGLNWESIPASGVIVTLNQKITWANGGTTEDVTDAVHPENAALFENIAAYLDDPIVGIDFIIRDIARSWKEERRAGVVELNSMPFLDNHHYLFEGRPRDAAGAVWDVAFDTRKG